MNKTVNINLANILFHIDEDAFHKMRLYLESIKRSFANTPGSDEILADIEARIAELLHEKLKNERQVITLKEIDEIISIMGQPEDYMVDEDIFEDEPNLKRTEDKRKSKTLYRDTEMKFVAGVSAGLAHYIGVNPLWIRLLWVILTLGSGGGFILLYALLWILIPEATTTSQKLEMRGEDINISNIERAVKEGFEDVAEKIKNVDYENVGNKVKSGGKTIFDTFSEIVLFCFKIFGKLIGIVLVIVGFSTIIGMFIGMITATTLNWIQLPGISNSLDNFTLAPLWVLTLLFFLAISIPFFFLAYLGLKILVNNLKSIGKIAKFSLLGLWLISIITLIIIGVKEAAAHAITGSNTIEKTYTLKNSSDTLNIELVGFNKYENDQSYSVGDIVMLLDDDGTPVFQSENVRINILKSNDSLGHIKVRKEANGISYEASRRLAENINYNYSQQGNTIKLNTFFTSEKKSSFNQQEVRVNIYLPVGELMKYTSNNTRDWVIRAQTNSANSGLNEHVWKMSEDGVLKCQECPREELIDTDIDSDNYHIHINKQGIDININDNGDSLK